MKRDLKEELEKKLDGRSLKWFYDNHCADLKISYAYFTAQLNGYNAMTSTLFIIIQKYLVS